MDNKEKLKKLGDKITTLVERRKKHETASEKLRKEINILMAEYERMTEIYYKGFIFKSDVQEI